MRRAPISQLLPVKKLIASTVILLLGLAIAPTPGRSADSAKAAPAAMPAARRGADQGAQDPTNFPRPAGLVRNSYSTSQGAARLEEVATYHAKGDFETTAGDYQDLLQAAGWTPGARSDSGSGFNRVRIVDWTTPGREAEVRFYPVKSGGTDLWVRVFTYKSKTPARAAAAGTATVPTAKQNTAPQAAALSRQLGAAPVGPPPTDLSVTCDGDAASHLVSWQAADWTGFDVYREQDGTWVQIGTDLKDTSVHESALVPPDTTYRVVVRHTDGSVGSADYVWTNPPQPGTVTGLAATQAGSGRVRVSWKAPPYATKFRVFITTGKPEGVLVTGSATTLTDVAPGKGTVRVAPCYTTPDGEELRYGNAWADVTVYGDRFRVVFLGVECVHETLDNPLQTDGKHDEIFAGAYVGTIPPFVSSLTTTTQSHIGPGPGSTSSSQPSHLTAEQNRRDGATFGTAGGINRHEAHANEYMEPSQIQCLRTMVMGDTNGFPDRIQAGTASDRGGIQTGDFVPSSAIISAQPAVAATPDRFPLLVWEGNLTPQGDYLEVAPVIFEWDDPAEPYWQDWCEWWTSPRGTQQLGLGSKTVSNQLFYPFAGTVYGTDSDGSKTATAMGVIFPADKTRPIGCQVYSSNLLSVREVFYQPQGLILTRSNVEAALGDKVAVVIPEEFNDDDGPLANNQLQGKYTLYIQLERVLPSTPTANP